MIRKLTFVFGIALAGVLLALASAPNDAAAIDPGLDSDQDGWITTVETALGSDPADRFSTPESPAVLFSCTDTADNDLDGLKNGADPGCDPPVLHQDTFPPAGFDVFDSQINLWEYPVLTPFGRCGFTFEGRGPVVVERNDPFTNADGIRQVEVEIVAMQIDGEGHLVPSGICSADPTPFPATLFETPDPDPDSPVVPDVFEDKLSKGAIMSQQADSDFPADSFFDVFLTVDTPLGIMEVGPPRGDPGDPIRVTNVIGSIPPFHTPDGPLNPFCYEFGGTHEHCPKPTLDHFKCYTAAPFDEEFIGVEDQFLKIWGATVTPEWFCNPVQKNGEGIYDEGAHLKLYQLEAPGSLDKAGGLEVAVKNQFGSEQILTVQDLVKLALPAQKDGHPPPLALSHFTCYSVEGGPTNATVVLSDQFGDMQGIAGEPKLLCLPADKTLRDGTTFPSPDTRAHLVCYEFLEIGPEFPESTVQLFTQFGSEKHILQTPVAICLPTKKLEVRR